MGKEDSLIPIVGQDVGLMVRGYAAAIDDGRVLVQRGILDLLLTTIPMDGHGFQKEVRKEDQVLLMRSLLGVVLKRDLSLSRRLQSWLLGNTELAPEKQVEFISAYGLDILCQALKEEMQDGTERQRPFRIMVALLDKWEIGYPLTEAFVLDAFSCLRDAMAAVKGNEELKMTGNGLWEGLDPYLTWKQLFRAVKEEMESEDDVTEVRKQSVINLVLKN